MIKDIVQVQRKCFSLSIRENAPVKFRKKWYLHLLGLPSVEIYAILVNQEIIGSCVLIVDLVNYRNDLCKIPAAQKLLHYIGDAVTLLVHPRLIKPLISKVFAKVRGVPDKSPPSLLFINQKVDPTAMAWCESVAILPKYQRLGMGKYLHDFILNRALEQGKKVLASSVDKTNKKSIYYFERLGYIPTNKGRNGAIIYKKFLNSESKSKNI